MAEETGEGSEETVKYFPGVAKYNPEALRWYVDAGASSYKKTPESG